MSYAYADPGPCRHMASLSHNVLNVGWGGRCSGVEGGGTLRGRMDDYTAICAFFKAHVNDISAHLTLLAIIDYVKKS